MKTAFEELYVPDTSAVIERVVTSLVERGVIRGRILIHRELIRYFEELASNGRAEGLVGLEEISRIRDLADRGLVFMEIVGELRPKTPQGLNVDQIIREYAYQMGAKLITANRIQALVAKSMGMSVLEIKPEKFRKLKIEEFFDPDTMSVHLKEDTVPRAKKGKPGYWYFEQISDRIMTREELEEIAREVIEAAKMGYGFIEIDRAGSTIVQLGMYRIIITRPPMSDGWEITAVRPIVRPKLEEYNLPEKLLRRLEERAEGILIAGAPGMGKTTFAQALAEYYMKKGKIIKTIESPRDMHLPPDITQYSKVYAETDELHDILLLSRPDYTVFDEMRNDEDFKLYVDLRLAGIGMIGVVHATTPIDAIQRFLRRVDLGMIPSIIDTVIFIDKGRVVKVYEVRMTVKLPTGLREAELARPVVEVRDFLTGELEYEIYTFGEQTMVVPVKKIRGTTFESRITAMIHKLLPMAEVQVDGDTVTVTIPRDEAIKFGKQLKKLRKLERQLGVVIRLRFA